MDDTRSIVLVHDLSLPLSEAHEALSAIRSGEVDALVVNAPNEAPRVFLLRGADDAHRVLLETLNEGAMTVEPDATVLYANRRAAELLGRPLERVLGASLARFIVEGDRATLLALFSAGGRASGKAEVTLLRDDGEGVPVMVSTRVVGGDREAYSVVLTDLSAMKAAQRALERANDELEGRVAARTVELEQVNAALRHEVQERTRLGDELRRKAEELTEADRRKDEFLSMLAHELRNPLSPISTAAEMLRPAALNNPFIDRYRTVIERQTRNLVRLVDDLLDVSRITRRSITLQMQEVELRPIVQSAVEAARPLIEACGHRLEVHLPAEPARLFADPTRFEQVLVNLLNNAAKYTERGGAIELSAAVEASRVVIRVRDTGVGIPADLLPHIFELFVQGERSLARSQGGLGIGLTLVKNLIEMHGGTVEARSEGHDRGTEVTIRVPLAVREEDARLRSATAVHNGSREPVSESQITGTKRVLVVEDNLDASDSLVDLLRFWGFQVLAAATGEDALLTVADFRPEAALIDVGLPGIDGYEVARRLRRERPEMLLIGLTGYGQERDRQQGADAGFHHHLVKPPTADVLRSLLDDDRTVRSERRVNGAAS